MKPGRVSRQDESPCVGNFIEKCRDANRRVLRRPKINLKRLCHSWLALSASALWPIEFQFCATKRKTQRDLPPFAFPFCVPDFGSFGVECFRRIERGWIPNPPLFCAIQRSERATRRYKFLAAVIRVQLDTWSFDFQTENAKRPAPFCWPWNHNRSRYFELSKTQRDLTPYSALRPSLTPLVPERGNTVSYRGLTTRPNS